MKRPSTFHPSDYVQYVIIYRPYQRKYKKKMVLTNARQAMSINLWNGRVYGEKSDGSRDILKETVN